MSRLRYQSFLILAPLFFLLLNFGLVFGSTLWAENPVPRFTWTAENANSNLTGVGLPHAVYGMVYGVVYGRNVPSQLVHSNFALNTNSCASCHITHMAPGSGLLFQRSIYNTCSTCHFDATINGYNVLTGFTSGGATAGGGRFFDGDFGAQTDGRRGVSFHLTTSVYEHWQAPGSGFSFSSPPPADSPWRQPFSCASCHGPHGTFSGRHLHFNVNGQARRFGPVTLVEVSGDVSGAVYEPAPPYNNRTPWLFYDQDSPLFEAHAVRILNAANHDVTAAFRVNNRLGRVWLVQPALAGAGPYRISFSQATVVNLELQNAGTSTETVVYRGGVVNFCTACHTGYLQRSTVDGSVYTRHANFEHPVGSDINPAVVSGSVYAPPAGFRLEQHGTERRLVCLSCHFAHGTDVARMTRRDFTAPAYPASSALIPTQTRLLRFGSEASGNREVCLVCHAATDSRLTNNLTVLSTQPASGSTGATENIVINFDRRVDLASVSLVGETDRVSLRVYGSVYGTVAGSVYLSNDFRTLVFAPSQPLPSQLYTVQLPVPTLSVPGQATILSWFGRRLAELYSFSFTVP
ncbi:MAG: Ig-like domain-containing protein [Dethiobacter sp.]|nr:Ig-like domain-containing protein [Dethiobacter sp.]